MPQVLCREQEAPEGEKEEKIMSTANRYALVLAVVNRGSLDTVMDAARSEGARGGTVLHARRVGLDDTENLLGFTLQPEKRGGGDPDAGGPKSTRSWWPLTGRRALPPRRGASCSRCRWRI